MDHGGKQALPCSQERTVEKTSATTAMTLRASRVEAQAQTPTRNSDPDKRLTLALVQFLLHASLHASLHPPFSSHTIARLPGAVKEGGCNCNYWLHRWSLITKLTGSLCSESATYLGPRPTDAQPSLRFGWVPVGGVRSPPEAKRQRPPCSRMWAGRLCR